MLNLSHIFANPTHLHLVMWNRLEPGDHSAAMNAIHSLMASALAEHIVPMIRPLGRPYGTYDAYRYEFDDSSITAIRQTPLIDGTRTAHCELWINVSEVYDQALRCEIRQLFVNCASACFFWSHKNPVWAPLGSSITECQYAQARHGRGTQVLCDLQSDVPKFLKLIWFRASEVSCHFMQSTNGFTPLQVTNNLYPLRQLMTDAFRDLNACDYSLTSKDLVIDPTDFGVAHLAAFAFNALTPVQLNHVHQIEQYLNNPHATHPEAFPDRTTFLSLFPA